MIKNEFMDSQMMTAALELAIGVAKHYEGVVVRTKGNAVMFAFPSGDHKYNYIEKCTSAFRGMEIHEVISLPGLNVTVKASV
jgi:hypothetical protein